MPLQLLLKTAAALVQKRLAPMLSGVLRRVRRHKLAAAGRERPGRIVIMEHPATYYKPSNPKWLIEGVSWTPDSIPQELLVEPPPLTEFKTAVAAGKLQSLEFGSQECRDLFCLDPDFAYLNHGSYGAAYRLALDVQTYYREQLEREPVEFMETAGLAALVTAVAGVAGFVGADWRDVVPVVNATTGVNAVLQSLNLQKGDCILITNATYAAVRSAVAHTAAAAGAGILELNLELADLQDEERLVSAFQQALSAAGRGKRLRLAVLDLILSFPPVIMPVKRLSELFRAAGVPVLVDGAHSVGALLDLKVPQLGADYFVSTLHKWLCTPKGAAMLWVHPSKQHAVHPCVVSHGYELGYRAEFLWQGTSDFTAWLAAPACLAMQRALQPSRITYYNHSLVKQAAQMLLDAWGTTVSLGVSPGDGSTAGMVAVEVPWPLSIPSSSGGHGGDDSSGSSGSKPAAPRMVRVAVNGQLPADGAGGGSSMSSNPKSQPTPADASALNLHLRQREKIEVPVAVVEGVLLARISGQVYNKLADYERLRDVVLALRVG